MAENRKNLCAMIPVELHVRVREALEQAEREEAEPNADLG